MKIYILLFSILFFNTLYAKGYNEKCDNNITNLTVYQKNDFTFSNYKCVSSEGVTIKNYIKSNKIKLLINEYYDFSAKDDPELLAISIYKKKNIPPLLITLHSSYHCCIPQLEGSLYKVNFYEISKNNKSISLNDVTYKFGSNSDGFDGFSEGRVSYKYKNISSIKSWLEKNYK